MSGAPRSDRYLIRKGAYWYRPNACGYTDVKHEAGRYTHKEAERYTHPNGPNGPRDGMSFAHEDDAPVDRVTALRDAAWQAGWAAGREAALTAVRAEQSEWREEGHPVQANACDYTVIAIASLPVPPPPHGEVG